MTPERLKEIKERYRLPATRELIAEVERLREGLEKSVVLQSHYARLLNDYDGGKRRTFDSADEWLARLDEILKGKQ